MVRRLRYIKRALVFILSTVIFSSCGDTYCDESGSGMPLVGVYAMGVPPVEAQMDSVTIYGVGQATDSILYNNASAISSFYTPLNIMKDSVKYVIQYESKLIGETAKRDTLTYVYRKQLTFEKQECGATYAFIIDKFSYTTHSLVYAELVTPEVDNLSSQTVKIYYETKN